MRVEIVKCDRCERVIDEPDAEGNAADLEVTVPWCEAATVALEDLCEDCRSTVLGYLAHTLKLDREELAESAGVAARVRRTRPVVDPQGEQAGTASLREDGEVERVDLNPPVEMGNGEEVPPATEHAPDGDDDIQLTL